MAVDCYKACEGLLDRIISCRVCPWRTGQLSLPLLAFLSLSVRVLLSLSVHVLLSLSVLVPLVLSSQQRASPRSFRRLSSYLVKLFVGWDPDEAATVGHDV